MPEPNRAADEANLPSPETRGVLSLLLFIHFFAVVLALVAYPKPSELQNRLMNVVGPYLKVLNVDPTAAPFGSPRWFLSHGLPTDIDFAVEVDVRGKDGQLAESVAVIPDPGLSGQRRLRYQSLANALGSMANNEAAPDTEAQLPKAIASSVIARKDGTSGAIRATAHYLVDLTDRNVADPAKSDPFNAAKFATVFDAQVLINGKNIDLLKAAAKGEVAPVTKGPTGK